MLFFIAQVYITQVENRMKISNIDWSVRFVGYKLGGDMDRAFVKLIVIMILAMAWLLPAIYAHCKSIKVTIEIIVDSIFAIIRLVSLTALTYMICK